MATGSSILSKIGEIINTIIGLAFWFFIVRVLFMKKKGGNKDGQNGGNLPFEFGGFSQKISNLVSQAQEKSQVSSGSNGPLIVPPAISNLLAPPLEAKLSQGEKYLQVALNSTLDEAQEIIYQLPKSPRILVEAGTPLIKIYGMYAVRYVKSRVPRGTYIVADMKTADLADREVQMAAEAGAHGVTCLGVAPIDTIALFIEECEKAGLDSMVDMMNVEDPLIVLRQLKKPPKVVVLHRGVDETEFNNDKLIPYYQIKKIKGNINNIIVAVAGGDTLREVESAIFNDADIVVVWKSFYNPTQETAGLVEGFLKAVR